MHKLFFSNVFQLNVIKCESDEEPATEETRSLLEAVFDVDVRSRTSFEEFTDECMLTRYDAFRKKTDEDKLLDVSDEVYLHYGGFGDRVKVTKISHDKTPRHAEIEEAEFDIKAIEQEIAEKHSNCKKD